MLRDACPKLFEELAKYFSAHSQSDISTLLNSVAIAAQQLHGSPNDFRFFAYPVSLLDNNDRISATLSPEHTVTAHVLGGEIDIDLDVFGRTTFFYVRGLDDAYSEIARHLQIFPDPGDSLP